MLVARERTAPAARAEPDAGGSGDDLADPGHTLGARRVGRRHAHAELEVLAARRSELGGGHLELSRDVGTLGADAREEPAERGPAPTPSAPPSDGGRSDDEAGARLVALNMALEGIPREETARFLGEHYALAHLDALLDDVYASAGR